MLDILNTMSAFYTDISQMEPLLLNPIPQELENLVLEIIRQSAKLGATLHPRTQQSIVEIFREMNSYYSNLIEGNNTSPLDIQKALKKDYAKDPAKRALQQESVAHIEVQQLIDKKMLAEPNLSICNTEFICWIHEEFYKRLPEELKVIKSSEETILKNGNQKTDSLEDMVIPGALRIREVKVGNHIPPTYQALPNFLKRFFEVYEPNRLNGISQIIALAASHHRLAWIHPFWDGNGRVIRLFSDAYFKKTKIDGQGLWTMSRGLARNKKDYMHALMMADSERQGDWDGCGNLSKKSLEFFCKFFLEVALDQIKFVTQILDMNALQKRMEMYVNLLVAQKKLKREAFYLLQAVLLNGEIPRGEVARYTNMSERSARNLLKTCLELELLVSDSPKGLLRLGFPYEALNHYFPLLYTDLSKNFFKKR